MFINTISLYASVSGTPNNTPNYTTNPLAPSAQAEHFDIEEMTEISVESDASQTQGNNMKASTDLTDSDSPNTVTRLNVATVAEQKRPNETQSLPKPFGVELCENFRSEGAGLCLYNFCGGPRAFVQEHYHLTNKIFMAFHVLMIIAPIPGAAVLTHGPAYLSILPFEISGIYLFYTSQGAYHWCAPCCCCGLHNPNLQLQESAALLPQTSAPTIQATK